MERLKKRYFSTFWERQAAYVPRVPFTVLDLIGKNMEGQRANMSICFRSRLTVRETTRQLRHFCDVPAVRFSIEFDRELHDSRNVIAFVDTVQA